MDNDFKIPFGGRGHWYLPSEEEVVLEVMRSAVPLTQGAHRNLFEEKFTAFSGARNCFAVSNATMGMEVIAQLCGFDSGDEVIIPAHTFTSSAYPFIKAGAKIVWADIDPVTGTVTEQTVRDQLTDRTKAIVVTHLYGFCIPMLPIVNLARERNLLLIEDAAQALGARYSGQMAGTFGDFGVFSFHSHKNITTLGEGGMVSVADPELAKIVPLVRHNGHAPYEPGRPEYWKPAMSDLVMPVWKGKKIWPMNCCLGEVECALGAQLLDRANQINIEKRERALRFIDRLERFKEISFHRVPSDQHCYHLLIGQIAGDQRDTFIHRMATEHKIQCIVMYCPLYRYPFYEELGLSDQRFPNTDKFFDQMISFPFSHLLSEDALETILVASENVLETM